MILIFPLFSVIISSLLFNKRRTPWVVKNLLIFQILNFEQIRLVEKNNKKYRLQKKFFHLKKVLIFHHQQQ